MKKQISFKKSSNGKGYRFFTNLKKKVIIGTLSLTCLSLFAQESNDSIKNIQLDNFEVVSKHQEIYSDLTRIVSVMEKEEIENAPVETLADLLNYVAGVDIRQRGANGVQADIVVRGGTFDQVLILLNGVNITDPQTGHHNLNIPIDVSAIDRIEILQGPGSRVLGPNAFSGAINIITGTANKTGGLAKVEAGDHGLFSSLINVSIVNKKVKAFASMANASADGYMQDTDYKITNTFAQLRYDSKTLGDVNIQMGYQDKWFGAYGFYTLAYPNQFEATKTFFTSISTKKRMGKFVITPQVYWRQNHDRFELFRDFDGAAAWYSSHNYHQTDIAGANISSSYYSKIGKTTAGLDYRLEHIYSNKLGESISVNRPVPFAPDSTYFTNAKGRHNLNYFIEQAIFLKKYSASIGALGNTNNDYGSNFYFGGDMGYTFNKAIKAFASVNQSLRLPTYTDLYLQTSVNQGNPDLKAEKALTYELGATYKNQLFAGRLAAYYRKGKDVIDWVKLPSETKYMSKNHSEVNSLGADISLTYSPNKWVKRVKISYSFLQLDTESGAYDSKYALDYLKNKLGLDFEHKIYKGISASWRLNYLDRKGNYTDASSTLVDYKPTLLTDVRLQWTIKRMTLFTEASNLFDTPYINYGVEQPGRWVKGGLQFKL